MYKTWSKNDCPDPKQFKIDSVYLRMAKIWSENSYCERNRVGCIVVKNRTIISDGYNGTPTGLPNSCEDTNNNTLNYVIHSEANAISKLAKSTISSEGSTIYITTSPCYDCAKLLIQSGVKRIVFSSLYRKQEAFELLEKANIETIYIIIEN